MTTHYQKIQALGNRMAENLTIMGVPSQFDEGGLTLADKILEIRDRFTSGILLYADKKIAQTGDTVKLYSLFLKDEIPQSGKTIRFIGDGLSTTVTKGEFEKIDGNHFYFNSPPSGSTFTLGRNNCIIFDHNSFTVLKDMVDTNYYTNGGVIRIKDKTVYYTDNNGVSQALDTGLSYLNEVRFVNNITPSFTILGYAEAVTGDDGVACVQYSCTGSGLREFYATSGTFVSVPCNVLDTLFYDEALSNAKASQYQKGDDAIEVNYNNRTILSRNSDSYSGKYTALVNGTPQWRDINQNYCIECDISYENDTPTNGSANILFGGQIIGLYRLGGGTSGNGHLKLITDGETLKPYWEDTHISSQDKTMSSSSLYGFQFDLYHKCQITFKNLKIYLI